MQSPRACESSAIASERSTRLALPTANCSRTVSRFSAALRTLATALATASRELSREATAVSTDTESTCSASSTSAAALSRATTARSTAVVLRKPSKRDCAAEKPQRNAHSGSVHESEALAVMEG